ncbi:MAG: zinc-dependent metalloprotease [Cyclobacteriaceae bacterium]
MKKFSWLLLAMLISFGMTAQKKKKATEPTADTKTITGFTANMKAYDGFFPFFWDKEKGKVYLVVDNLDSEFLYVNSLAAGVGSNDIGLDRGQLGNRRVVKFQKHGPKLMMIQPNYGYRAVSDNIEEVKSVAEAFASSILFGFPVTLSEGNKHLIDITDFLLRDSHGVVQRLASRNQGSYKLDLSRSAIFLDNTFNFPKNSEFESTLTFTGQPKGAWVRSVVPSPDAITVRMHHSFIELPDDNYKPRAFDPRSSFNNISYQDYATPIDQSLVKRFIVRHRLEKKNPTADLSEAVEPIVYYLDRGTPEPVRSALLDGARWWNQAFEAAGFKDGFQVRMMPEGAHPMDVRYNVIQWVHRSTRGWSYGASVVDPRTGEIIKGHVSLGSLRVRQDFLIAQGLLNQYDEGTEPMIEMALARLRQLSAHEVGHTIGLVHSYASSANSRASVMDYPHPTVKLDKEGNIDLSDAYDVNIGEWDKAAIRYGYSEVEEQSTLANILEEAFDDGLIYITDRDARAFDGAHPYAHLWDNGEEPADELNRVLEIRRTVLDKLSERSLPTGAPYSSLEEIMVPMYLFHRYQVDATSKVLGGINYNYAVKGGNQKVMEFLPQQQQMNALEALLRSISPENLMLSDELLMKIPPKAHGYYRNRETFGSKTGPAWDYYTAVTTAAQLTTGFLLNPHRANRLVMYGQLNKEQPGLEKVLKKISEDVFDFYSSDVKKSAINRMVQEEVLDGYLKLAISKAAHPDTKSVAAAEISRLASSFSAKSRKSSGVAKAHYTRLAAKIKRWQEQPEDVGYVEKIKAPDGSPIGMPSENPLYPLNCSHH